VINCEVNNLEKKFDFDKSFGFLFRKSFASLKMYFNKMIKENGIDATTEQWGLLNIIHTFPGITQSEIATRNMKDKTNITRMLDLLEKKGCIERKKDKEDRRIYRIFITNKGKLLLESIVPVAIKINEKATQGLTREEIIFFKNILEKIFNNTRE
jgi:DNA-binding MarR family transcriptional regulator